MSNQNNASKSAPKTWPDQSDSDELSENDLDDVAGGVGITHISSVSPITPTAPVVTEQKPETLKKISG